MRRRLLSHAFYQHLLNRVLELLEKAGVLVDVLTVVHDLGQDGKSVCHVLFGQKGFDSGKADHVIFGGHIRLERRRDEEFDFCIYF